MVLFPKIFYECLSLKVEFAFANSANPDEMPHYFTAASLI